VLASQVDLRANKVGGQSGKDPMEGGCEKLKGGIFSLSEGFASAINLWAEGSGSREPRGRSENQEEGAP